MIGRFFLPLLMLAAPAFAQDTPLLVAAKEFAFDAKLLDAKYKRAESPEDKRAIRAELAAMEAKFVAKALAICAKEPATQESFDFYAEVMTVPGEFGKTARSMIGKHHAAKPWVWQACVALAAMADPDAIAWLTAIRETNLLPKNKGIAAASLGFLYKKLALKASSDKQPALLASAKKALDEASKQFPNVRIDSARTVREFAADHLAGLANIPNLVEGKLAPEIVGQDLDGKPMKLSEYRGKVVLLDFWATWCPPCMALAPHMKKLHEGVGPKGFAVVGVNCDTDADDLKLGLERHGISWRSFKNDGAAVHVSDAWNVEKYPTLMLIDAQGVIRKIYDRVPEPELLAADVAKLLR